MRKNILVGVAQPGEFDQIQMNNDEVRVDANGPVGNNASIP